MCEETGENLSMKSSMVQRMETMSLVDTAISDIIIIIPEEEEEEEAAKPERQKRRKMVKWPSTKDKLQAIRRRSSLSQDQIQSLWLNYQDFCTLRSDASKAAADTKDKGYSKLLQGSMGDEGMGQLKLDLWAKVENDLNLRGLERYCNSEHREVRDTESKQARKAVLEAQAAIAKEHAEDEEMFDFGDYLATVSCEHTAHSKEFAHMIAKADEKAAKRRSCKLHLKKEAFGVGS